MSLSSKETCNIRLFSISLDGHAYLAVAVLLFKGDEGLIELVGLALRNGVERELGRHLYHQHLARNQLCSIAARYHDAQSK